MNLRIRFKTLRIFEKKYKYLPDFGKEATQTSDDLQTKLLYCFW